MTGVWAEDTGPGRLPRECLIPGQEAVPRAAIRHSLSPRKSLRLCSVKGSPKPGLPALLVRGCLRGVMAPLVGAGRTHSCPRPQAGLRRRGDPESPPQGPPRHVCARYPRPVDSSANGPCICLEPWHKLSPAPG
ncbi:hypothetical protein NDU88_003178 [Pleurodeles waltl]|uniref:Uncharacterized protein n=1 Tax=Pleurodeles waltl TaxID=8319 RepID=A0AAV7SCQ1_PLEWA|nr:hypothetical protein NDU88_003178 [Pleurodeles waltl]